MSHPVKTCAGAMRLSAWAWLLVSAAPLTGSTATAAAEPADFQAHLAAGEFAPALQIAQQADPAQRDALLAQIAAAQGQAGDLRSAITTAGQVQGDVARGSLLDQLAGLPFDPRLGGAAQADFDSLIELITTTVEVDSWADAGGKGNIAPFAGGVWVDADGLLRQATRQGSGHWLARLRAEEQRPRRRDGLHAPSPLRKVSLPRLERAVQLRLARGLPPSRDMLLLAGLQRIDYVFVDAPAGDLILAGPAGPWTTDDHGRFVSLDTGRPVLLLDDLVAVWRQRGQSDFFGCSIEPRQENLARTQQFLNESARQPLRPGQRTRWLETVRSHVGRQDIKIFGIDQHSHAARVLVEADYRMKLVGLGLEEGTPGVTDYLTLAAAQKDTPAMNVLRWWFALAEVEVEAAPQYHAFALRGQRAALFSENELLQATGRRVATGKADHLNRRFAAGFTQHFSALAVKYPVFAELENIFDLALAAALIDRHQLAQQARWHQVCVGPEGNYPLPAAAPPRVVESVVHHRATGATQILAAVSGGVHVAADPYVGRDRLKLDSSGRLESQRRHNTQRRPAEADDWWWD